MEGEDLKPLIRSVQYYETDMMGVTHHANYIHWMEEARIDFMDQLGFPYAKMEAGGVISPVTELSCKYRKPSSFGDEITITVTVESLGPVRMTLLYDMRNRDGETVCTARSEHAFLSRDGRILRLKREMPDFCAAIERAMREERGTGA